MESIKRMQRQGRRSIWFAQRAFTRAFGVHLVRSDRLHSLQVAKLRLEARAAELVASVGSAQDELVAKERQRVEIQARIAEIEREREEQGQALHSRIAELVANVGSAQEELVAKERQRVEIQARIAEIERERDLLVARDRVSRTERARSNLALRGVELRRNRLYAASAAELAGAKASDSSSSEKRAAVLKKAIVVVVTSASQLPQLSALAGSIRVRNSYELIAVAFIDVKRSEIRELCSRTGITLLSHDLKCLVGEPGAWNDCDLAAAEMPAATKYAGGEDGGIQDVATIVAEVAQQAARLRSARNLLNHAGASLLVLFEDNAEYATGIWVEAARELSVPSVILPYTIADQLEPAEAHYGTPSYWAENGVHNRLAKAVVPRWLFHFRDRWLLRRSGASILAAEALGVAPPLPWILNSSYADVIAAESDAMFKHYTAHGIPETQLVLTGSVTDDLVYEAARQRDALRAELGLDERPVLLCSFPPDQLSANRHESEFADFRAIADFWLDALGKLDWQVLVKPHPSMRSEDVNLLRAHDVRVVAEYETMSLLPLCDIYNASVSSTIRWALACGKPVLNYDVYRYSYLDFAAEPAVLTVQTAVEFSDALQSMTGDIEVLQDYAERAGAASGRWGMMDGKSMERIVAIFDELTDLNNPLASPRP